MLKLGMEPAFPRKGTPRNSQFITEAWAQDGMSVRTYAAIQIMSGLLSDPKFDPETVDDGVKSVIKFTDGLLLELSKSNSGEGA
jgi:hypothetical protein